MYTFLIQKPKKGNEIDIDTATLIESINYQNFLHENSYSYVFADDVNELPSDVPIDKLIPYGTVEWVLAFINYLNLPTDNFKPIYEKDVQTHLKIMNLSDIQETLINTPELFIKETDKFKSGFADVYGYFFNSDNSHVLSEPEYFVSTVKNIISEYRVFVFYGQIKAIQHYDGDFMVFPTEKEINLLNKSVEKLNDSDLKAYTLDLGITDGEPIIIEIHPFFSCGLYGFDNFNIIPQMYISGFKYLTKNN